MIAKEPLQAKCKRSGDIADQGDVAAGSFSDKRAIPVSVKKYST